MSGSKEAEDKKIEQINEAVKKLDTSAFIHHKLTTDEAIKQLQTDVAKGLTSEEHERRLAKFG